MAIEIKGLTKHYGNVQALRGIDLTLEPGKIYGLLGRNGAGKTTMLNILTGRQFATAGTVSMDGAPIAENDEALRQIYMLSEATYYPESMKVREAIKWSAAFYPDFDSSYADELTGRFGLNVNSRVSALSTGYNTIFKLIVALACGAPYLFLDEPVLGLDANHRDLFYKSLIQRYSDKPCCVVLSTHLVEEVSTLVEDVVIIHQGSILKHQTREELLAQGYTVTGSAAKVDAYAAGKNVIGTDAIGGLKTVYILGQRGEGAEGLEFTGLDLQRLFVQLTND
ncbi:ABC transporter ATP-binding protein [Ruminococcaceae bacterium OttesenSCG-928-D13]|nr:ABC transporter ATP-binding protein [Ruminococcaceae bacterium OttesenSCG-928-D13]